MNHILHIFVALGAIIAAACVLAFIYGAAKVVGHIVGL